MAAYLVLNDRLPSKVSATLLYMSEGSPIFETRSARNESKLRLAWEAQPDGHKSRRIGVCADPVSTAALNEVVVTPLGIMLASGVSPK